MFHRQVMIQTVRKSFDILNGHIAFKLMPCSAAWNRSEGRVGFAADLFDAL